jgi:hypothetical protein
LPAKARRTTPPERRGRDLARRFDWTFVAALKADRYDPDLFASLCKQLLSETDDPWEQLEIRRRCAGRQFALAEAHGRGIRELARLFNAQRALGYSSLNDECGHLGLYAHTLAKRGHPAQARALLREFAERVDRFHTESGHMRKALKQMIASIKPARPAKEKRS